MRKERKEKGTSTYKLGRKYGLCNQQVGKIVSGKSWKYLLTTILMSFSLALSGCTEYVGVARAPTLPLPDAPIEEPVQATRTEDGLAFTLPEWRKAQRNTEKLRVHIARLRAIIETFNRIVKSLQRGNDD